MNSEEIEFINSSDVINNKCKFFIDYIELLNESVIYIDKPKEELRSSYEDILHKFLKILTNSDERFVMADNNILHFWHDDSVYFKIKIECTFNKPMNHNNCIVIPSLYNNTDIVNTLNTMIISIIFYDILVCTDDLKNIFDGFFTMKKSNKSWSSLKFNLYYDLISPGSNTNVIANSKSKKMLEFVYKNCVAKKSLTNSIFYYIRSRLGYTFMNRLEDLHTIIYIMCEYVERSSTDNSREFVK
jgi:hypothetical protein